MTEQEKPLDNEDIEILTYNFTKREVYILAKFLRKKGASLYQEAIDEIAINENITYVYNGELFIENSYKVKNDSQIKKVLVELCA